MKHIHTDNRNFWCNAEPCLDISQANIHNEITYRQQPTLGQWSKLYNQTGCHNTQFSVNKHIIPTNKQIGGIEKFRQISYPKSHSLNNDLWPKLELQDSCLLSAKSLTPKDQAIIKKAMRLNKHKVKDEKRHKTSKKRLLRSKNTEKSFGSRILRIKPQNFIWRRQCRRP